MVYLLDFRVSTSGVVSFEQRSGKGMGVKMLMRMKMVYNVDILSGCHRPNQCAPRWKPFLKTKGGRPEPKSMSGRTALRSGGIAASV